MKRSSRYDERGYAFGQAMLTLRTNIGLTQAGLADLLHVSRRAVAEWEAGSNYPKAEHLKQLIALAVQQQAFPAGREAEEIRALWQAAHQRVLLDEIWLRALLAPPTGAHEAAGAAREVTAETGTPMPARTPAWLLRTRIDWIGALGVSGFQGREVELAELSQWILSGLPGATH